MQFRSTLTIGFTTITAIFLLFGAAGYAAFGDMTCGTITLNLPKNDWTSDSVKLALCCALFFTFPIMMVPVYEILERSVESSKWFELNISPARRPVPLSTLISPFL